MRNRMVRVRIAPSPTGDPHVGTAYIALFNYVFAKKHGGQFVLRIEDTDQARSKPEWAEMIFDALRWVGVIWDEGPDVGGPHGPYRQSERTEIYRKHCDELLASGAAYRCCCTSERLAELRKEQRERKANFGYDGHCRDLPQDEIEARITDGVPHVVRLRVPNDGDTVFKDELRGDVTFENAQIDDQVLLKSDGMPTYHLANVVDDHLMEITHVMRAEEWITSTPKHVLLYEAFGWQQPKWVHLPLLRNKDKSKISKRKNPVSLNYYRDAGFYPEAMLNYLGMMGWTMPDGREIFSVDDMIEQFDFERISLGGPVFDVTKLTWLNGEYIRAATAKDLATKLRTQLFSDERIAALAPLFHERIDTLEEFVEKAGYFFTGDVVYDDEATKAMVPKKSSPKQVRDMLGKVLELLDGLPSLEEADLEQRMRAICEESELKPKELFMPVRVAVTGRKATPGLFQTMVVLGKERCRRRLRGAIAHLKTLG